MDGTPQDRQCTRQDFYWASLGANIGNEYWAVWAGASDGVTFNTSMLFDDSNLCNYGHTPSYWVGNALGVAVGALALGSGAATRTGMGAATSTTARSFSGFTAAELRTAAQVVDRNGLTAAGRQLQKHAGREGSVFSGLSTGTAANRNAQGLQVLDEILDDPRATVAVRDRVVEVWDATGRGVRFTTDGSLIGFLEPR